MSYTELFYGEQPTWMGSSRNNTYYTTAARPAGWKSTSLVFHVALCCENCVQKIRKALAKDEEVETVDVDMQKSKVIVTGYLNPERVLRKIRKVKKSATFWDSTYDYTTQSPYSHAAEYDYTDPHAFDSRTTYPSSYSYEYSASHSTPRSSYYEYSRDSPNSYYNRGGSYHSSYDAYRYR